jgi:hypothetical protein
MRGMSQCMTPCSVAAILFDHPWGNIIELAYPRDVLDHEHFNVYINVIARVWNLDAHCLMEGKREILLQVVLAMHLWDSYLPSGLGCCMCGWGWSYVCLVANLIGILRCRRRALQQSLCREPPHKMAPDHG